MKSFEHVVTFTLHILGLSDKTPMASAWPTVAFYCTRMITKDNTVTCVCVYEKQIFAGVQILDLTLALPLTSWII